MHLAGLLGCPLLSSTGEAVGKVDDLIVRLRGGDYPLVTGLVARVGKRRVFIPVGEIAELRTGNMLLPRARVDLRSFERRDGEVLLREDILGHRLIDVADAELVRAWDIELRPSEEGWVVSCLDTRRPARLFGLVRTPGGHPCRDWKAFEPLVGHTPSALVRAPFGRVRRLKPAQIANLIEDASRQEGEEILDVVHADPELEADVFEELDTTHQLEFLEDRSDADAARLLARMEPDNAADLINEIDQERRLSILENLPAGQQAKVRNLLAYNADTAGGMMNPDFVSVPATATVAEALAAVRDSRVPAEALQSVYVIDEHGQPVGAAAIADLVRARDNELALGVARTQLTYVHPHWDLHRVARKMSDFNLTVLPVVDETHGHMIGVVTVDDLLEELLPQGWRREFGMTAGEE